MMKPVFLTIRQFAERYGVQRTKIYELIQVGEIDVAKIGRRTLITFKSAQAFAKRVIGER